MQEKITLLENEIEDNLQRLSLNSEIIKHLDFIRNKYDGIKGDSSKDNSFEMRKYYALLLDFNDTYMDYLIKLAKNKKENKSIYDLSDNELDEKTKIKENQLDGIISYLKKEFPIVGNSLEIRFARLKEEYIKDLKLGLSKDKNEVELFLGVTKDIVLSFGKSNTIKQAYLNNLEIFDELFLNQFKKMIVYNLEITKKYHLLLEQLDVYKDDSVFIKLIDKLNLTIKEYETKCQTILNNNSLNNICTDIHNVQNDFMNRLNQFENNIKKEISKRETIDLYQAQIAYLGNLDFTDIDYKKLKKIEKYFMDNDLLSEEYYDKLYTIIELELVKKDASKVYENISPLSKRQIEKIFIEKLKKSIIDNVNGDLYLRKLLNEGFNVAMLLDIIGNIDELKEKLDQNIEYDIKENELLPIIIRIKYQYHRSFSEGLVAVQDDEELWGYINKDVEEVIACKYKSANDFSEGLAAVQDIDSLLWGYINKDGEEVIACKYRYAGDFSEGLAAVQDDEELWGYINKDGKEVIACKYKNVDNFSEGLAFVENNEDLFGYINKDGEEVIACKYNYAGHFTEGLAAVQDIDSLLWRYINKDGEEVTASKYDDVRSVSEELIPFPNGKGLWGYNEGGKEVIACKYRYAGNFSEGLAAVQDIDGLWGYINKDGKIIIKHQYRSADSIKDGIAIIYDKYRRIHILSINKKIKLNLEQLKSIVKYHQPEKSKQI